MKPTEIREFPLTVECPKDFIRREVWVRELVTPASRFPSVNGCDCYCLDVTCQTCIASVRKTVMTDR